MAEERNVPMESLIRRAVFSSMSPVETRHLLDRVRSLPGDERSGKDLPDVALEDEKNSPQATPISLAGSRGAVLSFALTGLVFALVGIALSLHARSLSLDIYSSSLFRAAAMISICSALVFTWLGLLVSRDSVFSFYTALVVVALHVIFSLTCGMALSLSTSGTPVILPSLFWIGLAFIGLMPLIVLVLKRSQGAGVPFTHHSNRER